MLPASNPMTDLSYGKLMASLGLLVTGVVVLDLGVQAGLVSNQTRAFAVDRTAQG